MIRPRETFRGAGFLRLEVFSREAPKFDPRWSIQRRIASDFSHFRKISVIYE